MPSANASVHRNGKRKLNHAESETNNNPPQPTAKPSNPEAPPRHRTPSFFWDNLSRIWLTRRALREFDRRTVSPAAPVSSYQTGKDNIELKKLKRFARHGGPSLGDIRGCPDPETSAPTMDSSQSDSKEKTKTRRTSAYDEDFEQHLKDHGIYKDNRAQKPSNWEEINKRLAQRRPSLSPSQFTEAAFEAYRRINEEAVTEARVMSNVFPIIAGTADIPSMENLRFTNLKELTDGSITKAQPDFYDGAHPEELNKHIRGELGPYTVPSMRTLAPCLPNFFTEAKGPKGLTDVAKNQAMYDGALGARGIHELRSYIDLETVNDHNAYTIACTYKNDGLLTMYTIHPMKSTNPEHPTEYRITQLRSFAMADVPDTFRQGATFLRNARDLMAATRKELIAAANTKALGVKSSGIVSSSERPRPESEMAADLGNSENSSERAPIENREDLPTTTSSQNKGSQTKKRPAAALEDR